MSNLKTLKRVKSANLARPTIQSSLKWIRPVVYGGRPISNASRFVPAAWEVRAHVRKA